MPKITIESIPHKDQRYNTVGDWTYDSGGNIEIKISEMDQCSFYAVAIHELIEAVLCWNEFIHPEVVDDWDLSHDDCDPGSIAGCPYGKQHNTAGAIEMLSVLSLGLDWFEHEAELDRLTSEYREKDK